MKITTHLPTTTPSALHRATTHPFLRLAGTGALPKETLSAWLSQDRLYAQSYVRFIGLLLSKLNLPVMPVQKRKSSARGGEERNLQSEIMAILIDALNNIQTELGFFEDVAEEYGLDLNTPLGSALGYEEMEEQQGQAQGQGQGQGFRAGAITQGYIDMFMSAGSPGVSLLEGLVVLWATEICYLKAWRFAQSHLDAKENGTQDRDSGALRKRFIPNWASQEFEAFVDKIGGVVDEVAEKELGGDVEGNKEGLARCEHWWRRVVWLEERFWPKVQE